MKLLALLVCALTNLTVAGVKVSSRFDSIYDPNARCLIQQIRQYGDNKYAPRSMRLLKQSMDSFHKFNCSMDMVESREENTPDENGTYSGVIGMIQRHEQDIGWLNIRPDSLPFEPGKIAPPLVPADVTIISHRNKSHIDRHEITSFLDQDACVYAYSVIVLAFMASCLLIKSRRGEQF